MQFTVHKVNTQYRHAFYRSNANFMAFQKYVHYEAIKLCELLMGIQSLSTTRKQYQLALTNSFCHIIII
jgi:hypothetical protein